MSIQKDLKALTDEKIISPEIAKSIADYYDRKSNHQQNRILIIFSVLGAILIGLGVILMVAHNWDQFNRTTKTIFSFLPLLIGQIFCFYTLYKKGESQSWREASAAFTFFAIGACNSLISQIYHLDGEMHSFLLMWLLPSIPLLYLLKSHVVTILVIAGSTWFVCSAGYDSNDSPSVYLYWLLIAFILPMYIRTYRNDPKHTILPFYHWMISLSLVISLGTIERGLNEAFILPYVFLFACFSLISDSNRILFRNTISNGYLALGSLGSHVILYPLSFAEVWDEMIRDNISWQFIALPEALGLIVLLVTACYLLFKQYQTSGITNMRSTSWLYLAFLAIYAIGQTSSIAIVLINLLILTSGILTIRQGAKQNHLGVLNYGLMIITILILCRFFDTDISFVVRGILFILVGAGFFAANYFMIKKRKSHEV